jgi:hypothetical protein
VITQFVHQSEISGGARSVNFTGELRHLVD